MTDTLRNCPYLQYELRDGQVGTIISQYVRDLLYSALSIEVGITASGTTQGTATPLTARRNIVKHASAGTGVIIEAGVEQIVSNRSGVAFYVYPPTGGQHEQLGAGVPILLPNGQDLICTCDPAAPSQSYVMWPLNLTNLPQSDPGVAGVPFSDGGILAISQGATTP